MSAFRTVVADPPWRFADKLPGRGRGAEKHYATMSLREIQRFSLPAIADDAMLFLWRVSSQVEEAYAVCRAWGFAPKGELVWVKTKPEGEEPHAMLTDNLAFGMGRYVRGSHESCIVARRGKAYVIDRTVRSVLFASRARHSEKPEAFYDLVERLSTGPYLELFARRRRSGWTCLGNEVEGDTK